jgi:hypothetical protein
MPAHQQQTAAYDHEIYLVNCTVSRMFGTTKVLSDERELDKVFNLIRPHLPEPNRLGFQPTEACVTQWMIKGMLANIDATAAALPAPLVWMDTRCDQCGKFPLCGTRYRCMDCPDIDFCAECFMNDPTRPIEGHNHMTHVMAALRTPEQKAAMEARARRV